MKLHQAVLLIFLGTSVLFAEVPDYAAWIGMRPAEACSVFGPPSHVYTHRGETENEDNVIFYRDGMYLFWFNNRVWQVRADRNSDAVIAGIRIGDSAEKVTGVLGESLYTESDGSLFFEIARKSFPLRLRLVFNSDDTVEDIYLYRGDY